MAVLGFALFILYGLAQFAAAFAGISDGFGVGWAWLALAGAIFLRFTLPITIGAFFGAMNVWGGIGSSRCFLPYLALRS